MISDTSICATFAPLKGGRHSGINAYPPTGGGVAHGRKERPKDIPQTEDETALEARAIAELERLDRALARKRRKAR